MQLDRSFFRLTMAFFALCAFWGGLAAGLGAEEPSATPWIVALVAFGVAGFLLASEARRDLDAVLTLVSFMFLAVALCVGIYLVYAHLPGLAPKVTFALSLPAAIGLGLWTIRRQRGGSSEFPNVLAGRVEAGSLCEAAGIQFAGMFRAGAAGRPHLATILLQNCFDAPRRVRITFDASSYAKYLRFEPHHEVALGPAEVASLEVPIVAPTYAGVYPLYFALDVEGTEGKRVRLGRAREVDMRIRPEASLALLAVGMIAWGGGICFRVGPLPDDQWSTPLPAPVRRTLWRPREGTVPRAVTGAPR